MDGVFAMLNVSTIILLLILGLLSATFVYYNYIYKPHQYFKQLGIPGPTPKPVIGNLDLLKKYNFNLSKYISSAFEEYGPTFGLYFGNLSFFITKDLDLLKLITVKHSDNFTDRTQGNGLITTRLDGKEYGALFAIQGDSWKKRRRILTPAFSGHKMKLMESLIKESTERLCSKISCFASSGETVDALKMYNKMTMEVILSTAFGRAVDVQNGKGGKLLDSAVKIFGSLTGEGEQSSRIARALLFLGVSFPKLKPLFRYLFRTVVLGDAMDYLAEASQEIIKSRRALNGESNTNSDLLGLMIEAGDGDSNRALSDGEIIAESVGFLVAGYETTSSALTFTTGLLASHPDIQEKLAEEIRKYFSKNPESTLYEATHSIDYLDMVFNEVLRLFPVGPATARICNEDIVLNGIPFKKGAAIMIPIYCVQRDPEIWPDPETFDPERFNQENKANRHSCSFLTFGSGPRSCIGMRLAYLEAKMALIEVVSKYKILLAPETKVPLKPVMGTILRAEGGVHVKFEAR